MSSPPRAHASVLRTGGAERCEPRPQVQAGDSPFWRDGEIVALFSLLAELVTFISNLSSNLKSSSFFKWKPGAWQGRESRSFWKQPPAFCWSGGGWQEGCEAVAVGGKGSKSCHGAQELF